MCLAEARITLGVVAARQGDLEQAIHHGTRALSAPRKSLPSLLMVSRDLTRVLNDQYPNEPETQAYLDQLHALSSLRDFCSWLARLPVLKVRVSVLRKRRPLTLGCLCQPSGPDGEGQATGQARNARLRPEA